MKYLLPRRYRSSWNYRTFAILLSLSLTTYLILFIHTKEDSAYLITIKERNISPKPICTFPVLPVDDPEIAKFIYDFPRIYCRNSHGNIEEDWVVVNGSQAEVTEAIKNKYSNVNCQFFDILRQDDLISIISEQNKEGLTYTFADSDFVHVTCTGGGAKWKSFLAAPRTNVEIPAETNSNQASSGHPKLNVLMWGYDSLSGNMFQRKLPITYKYLVEKLGGIVLEGYNIVGDGTPQALIPMLTGQTEPELPETRKRMENSEFVNVYPFVWKEFKENGYLTGFMEDYPAVGTFTYRLNGFDQPPTDFYMRPYFLAAESSYSSFPAYCTGAVPRHKIMMDYVKNILQYKKQIPKFIFSFHNELSHDDFNKIQGADEDMAEFFRQLNKSGTLDNTVLVVFSDHGSRFSSMRGTPQGKQEERMPMYMFIFPPSFKTLYPRAYENFKINAQILTTPFDIHPTLQDLLTISSKPDDYFSEPHQKRERGLSLFRQIFLDRTCEDAFIESHWCACLQWQVVDVNLPSIQKAAMEFVNFINNYLASQTTLCAELSLSQVLWAANLSPTDELLHFKKSADLDGFYPDLTDNMDISTISLELKVETTPGYALFEVSLQQDLKNEKFEFQISDISRINKYGSQAACVENNLEHLRKFCFCKN